MSPIRVLLSTSLAWPPPHTPSRTCTDPERGRGWGGARRDAEGPQTRWGRRAWEASGPAASAPVSGGASRPRGMGWGGRDPGGRDPRRDATGAGASALETWARETQRARRSGKGRLWRPRHNPEYGEAETENAPGQRPPSGKPPVGTGTERRLRGRNPGRQITPELFPPPQTESAAQSGTRIDGQGTTSTMWPGRPRSDPGGGTRRVWARATSPWFGAMGTRARQGLLLLLLLRPLLPPRGTSAGSLHSPGESQPGDWAVVTTPSTSSAPRTWVPRLGRGQSRWREQLSSPSPAGAGDTGWGAKRELASADEDAGRGSRPPQAPPSPCRPVRVLPGEWRRLPRPPEPYRPTRGRPALPLLGPDAAAQLQQRQRPPGPLGAGRAQLLSVRGGAGAGPVLGRGLRVGGAEVSTGRVRGPPGGSGGGA